MKKSELRSIIREMLREELAINKTDIQQNNTHQIIGCYLKDNINYMKKDNCLPKLPLLWFIDEIEDTKTDSRIVFSHHKLPVGVQVWCKYYNDDTNLKNCYYEFTCEIRIDNNTQMCNKETVAPFPYDFIRRIFKLVDEFDYTLNNSKSKADVFKSFT